MDVKEYTVSDLRRQLLTNGYTPLANRDKACYLQKWPTLHVTEREINRWSRMTRFKATGLRVENGLCVIDIDVNDPVIDDICDAMLSVLPKSIQPERLERAGKGYKIAWFCRTDELFSRLHTRRWVAQDAHHDQSEVHCVEIFGGGSARQFGSFGAHTINDENEIETSYRWVDESPENTPLEALDILTKAQLHAMIDAAEKEFKLRGFEPLSISKAGESIPSRHYSLTEDMHFDLDNDDTVDLYELEEMVRGGWTGRCSASFLEGDGAVNRSRCIITRTASNSVAIWESAAGETHLPVRLKPRDKSERVSRAQEVLERTSQQERTKLGKDDTAETCAAKLLENYTFLPTAKNPIFPIDALDVNDGISLTNFRTMHQPWRDIIVGPRGGEKVVDPVTLWADNHNRLLIKGVHMRPDKPVPTYEEDGEIFINTYRRPELGEPGRGTAHIGAKFMEQLVPDERERKWFLKWLAYKWRNPHVPGPALIMVAKQMGTGRGTFRVLLERLFGQRYVVPVPFRTISGSNSQAQYNSWALNAIFAVVDESSSGRDVSSFKARHDLYEYLKEIVEPRQTRRMYTLKHFSSFEAMSSMTMIFNTNHNDAIPLPYDDRRFAVLTNGERMPPRYWDVLNEWMDDPNNIAAFAEWLESIDLAGYDPYAVPIMTNAKADMAQFAKSDLTEIMQDIMENLGMYFTSEQVNVRIQALIHKGVLDDIKYRKDVIKRLLQRDAYSVKDSDGAYVRIRDNGPKQLVWTLDPDLARFNGTTAEIKELLNKPVEGRDDDDDNVIKIY